MVGSGVDQLSSAAAELLSELAILRLTLDLAADRIRLNLAIIEIRLNGFLVIEKIRDRSVDSA